MKNILFTLSTVAIMAIGVQAAEVSPDFEKIYSETYKNLQKQNPEVAKLASPESRDTFFTGVADYGLIEGETGLALGGYITHYFPTEHRVSLTTGVKFSDHSTEALAGVGLGNFSMTDHFYFTPGIVGSYLAFDQDTTVTVQDGIDTRVENKTVLRDDFLVGIGATVINTDTGIAVSGSFAHGIQGDLTKTKFGYGLPMNDLVGLETGSLYLNFNYQKTIVHGGDNEDSVTVGLSFTY